MTEEIAKVNLEDFVAEVLRQIINGVKKAQEHAKENDASIQPANLVRDRGGLIIDPTSISSRRPFVQEIEFDVAVTVDLVAQLPKLKFE